MSSDKKYKNISGFLETEKLFKEEHNLGSMEAKRRLKVYEPKDEYKYQTVRSKQ